MKQRSLISFLTASVIVLLLVGISGCSSWFAKSPVALKGGNTVTEPGAAALVAKSAPVMVSLLVNPDRLQLGRTNTEIDKLKTSVLANTGLNYKEDIQPWLGDEITLAVTSLDFDRDPENGEQIGYLMALGTDNPKQSREFVELFFSKRAIAGAKIEVEEYNGIKVITDNTEARQNLLSGAVVADKYVLFANDPKVLREAINNLQAPDLNLTTVSKYQEALKQLPPRSLALAYLNLPTVATWQKLNLTDPAYDTQIVAIALNSQGLLAETTLLTTNPENITPPTPPITQPVNALKYLPASAGMVIAGSDLSNLNHTNLATVWTQVTNVLSDSKQVANSNLINQPLAQLQQRWGINLPADIFSWVTGEYAIALLPNNPANDWIFIAEKTDPANDGITKLDQLATSKGLSITSVDLDDQKISAWTKVTTDISSSSTAPEQKSIALNTKVNGVHTTIGNYEVFTTSLEAMDAAITAQNSLAESRNFQASFKALPEENQGYLYVDWSRSQAIIERQIPGIKLLEVVARPFFSNLRSLTVSSYASDSNLVKSGMFFNIKD